MMRDNRDDDLLKKILGENLHVAQNEKDREIKKAAGEALISFVKQWQLEDAVRNNTKSVRAFLDTAWNEFNTQEEELYALKKQDDKDGAFAKLRTDVERIRESKEFHDAIYKESKNTGFGFEDEKKGSISQKFNDAIETYQTSKSKPTLQRGPSELFKSIKKNISDKVNPGVDLPGKEKEKERLGKEDVGLPKTKPTGSNK